MNKDDDPEVILVMSYGHSDCYQCNDVTMMDNEYKHRYEFYVNTQLIGICYYTSKFDGDMQYISIAKKMMAYDKLKIVSFIR
jgi:hypothetical protein